MRPQVELRGRRVAVVGLGKSGLAVARFCAERGAQVTGCDDRDEAALAAALSSVQSHVADGRLRLALGGLRAEVLTAADLIVLSPGVPPMRMRSSGLVGIDCPPRDQNILLSRWTQRSARSTSSSLRLPRISQA